MSGKNLNFDDKKIKESKLYKNKKVFLIDDVDVNKILVSKKEPYGTKSSVKYFIEYNDNDTIRPLCLRLPQMTCDARKWENVEKLININFENKSVYGDDDKYIRTKIRIYADNMITNFHNKKMPKEKAP